MWQIKIHSLVYEEDFKSLSPFQQKIILDAAGKKLSVDPKAYGKPLSGEFVGFWRLRVGDYRVVYQIFEKQIVVYVLKVGIRRDNRIYRELFSRLRKYNPSQ